MKALLLALAWCGILQDPDDTETCHADFLSLKVFNSNLRSACVAEGVLVNLAPFEIGDVSMVVTPPIKQSC